MLGIRKIVKVQKLTKNKNSFLPKIWKSSNNEPISCSEKIKILNENVVEIKKDDDAIEDAELMGEYKQLIEILKSL